MWFRKCISPWLVSPPTALIATLLLLAGCAHRPLDMANTTNLCTTPQANSCDWMAALVQQQPEITLSQVCLPGSHDAGMYTTQYCTAFANYGNTQTQYLDFQHQLEAGIRIYDVRPVLYKGDFYTEHCTKCDGLGCKGGSMRDILTQTRAFLDTHAELVVFELSHFCHSSPTDSALLALITATLGDRIYREGAPTGKPFIQLPLRRLIGDGKKGKVLLLFEGLPDTESYRQQGWYSHSVLPMTGGWSNDNYYDELRTHQLERFAKYTGNGNALYQLAWQVTQHTPQAVRGAFDPHSPTSIRHGANTANADLPHFIDSLIKTNTIRRGRIPNIIWDDMADTMVTHQAIKLNALQQ